jgi:hypothetical protein
MAPSSEVQPRPLSSAMNNNMSQISYGQCEMPSVTVAGVLEYFQEALSPESRKLSNEAPFEPSTDNVSRSHNTIISARKEPGRRAGVIFTRLSEEHPTVAVISMIMHDSIFAKHNRNHNGKLEGSVVVAINGVSVEDARHAARLVILAEGRVDLTVQIDPLKTALEVEEEKVRIAMGAVEVVQENLSEIHAEMNDSEEVQSIPSTTENGMEVEYNAVVRNSTILPEMASTSSSASIIEMAPSSLKLQLKDRMESKKHSFDPLDQNYSSLMMSSSCSTSEASSELSSIHSRRMNLFADRLDDNSSTRSDTSRISRFLDLKRAESLCSASTPLDMHHGTCPPTDIEDEIMTPKKNNINKDKANNTSSNDEYSQLQQSKNTWSKDMKHHNDSQQLYMNSSSVTSATVDLTYVPSLSNDDASTANNMTSSGSKLETNLRIDPSASADDEASIKDLPTPMLLQKIENLFGSINNKQSATSPIVAAPVNISAVGNKVATASLSSSDIKLASSKSFASSENNARANDIFDRIMNKYSKMSSDSIVPDAPSAINTKYNPKEISVAPDCNEEDYSQSPASLERRETNKYFSNLLRQQAFEVGSISNGGSVKFMNRSEDQHELEQANSKTLNLHRRVKMMQIQLKESIDEDGDDDFIDVGMNEYEDDDVSTLSRSTCLTIGSASFCSTDTKEIQAHVKSLVHGIVQRELMNSGSMKKELEEALQTKARLESRVRRLVRRKDKQQLQLREANLKNETIIEEIDKEMTVHLTRKAAELKSCVEAALEQAEESKRRAVALTKNSMEQEILTLRRELDEALANGVQLDSSLQRALALVESNQQTLRLAAESDARDAVKMKREIESSFVSTVDEFEAWAEKQVTLMERLESSMTQAGGINADDEAKLLKIKHSLESAMSGMSRIQYRRKTRTQSGKYTGYV